MCPEYADQVPLLGTGELSIAEEATVREHLVTCAMCHADTVRLAPLSRLLGRPLLDGWAADVAGAVRARLHAPAVAPAAELPKRLAQAVLAPPRRRGGLVAGVASGLLALALVTGLVLGIGGRSATPPRVALPLVPDPVQALLGSARLAGVAFGLQGDPATVDHGPMPTGLAVYRLAPPPPMDAATANRIALEQFGMKDPPQMGLDNWSWRGQGPQLTILPPDGTRIWSNTQVQSDSGSLDAAVAVAQSRDWLAAHGLAAGQSTPGAVSITHFYYARSPQITFGSQIDGLPLYTVGYRPADDSSGWPGIRVNYFPTAKAIDKVLYVPPRAISSTQTYPLGSAQAAWAAVQSAPVRHVLYAGFVTYTATIQTIEALDLGRDFQVNLDGPYWRRLPQPLNLRLTHVQLGYAYSGGPDRSDPLYLVPVYAFEAHGQVGAGREVTALFLAAAPAADYVAPPVWPAPDYIAVYHNGQAISFAPATTGYRALLAAATPLLADLGWHNGEDATEPYTWQERERDLGIELTYKLDQSNLLGVPFPTDGGMQNVHRLFVPLSPAVERDATVWISGQPSSWTPFHTGLGSQALRIAVEKAVAGRQDWGTPPATITPSPAPTRVLPTSVLPSPVPTDGPAKPVAPLPPPVRTVFPTPEPPQPTPTLRPTPLAAAAAPLRLGPPQPLSLHPAVARWDHDAGAVGIDPTKPPILSPTGDAFLVATKTGQLWLVPTTGEPPVQLVVRVAVSGPFEYAATNATTYAWSADGREVFYAVRESPRPGTTAVQMPYFTWIAVSRDGQTRRPLGATHNTAESWSSDGATTSAAVAFVTAEGIWVNESRGFVLVPADGSRTHPVEFSGVHTRTESAVVLSPDGSRLAYPCQDGVCQVDRKDEAPATTRLPAPLYGFYQVQALAWSPDGSRLAVLVPCANTGGTPVFGRGADVVVIARDGTRLALVPVTPDDGSTTVAWTGDGRYLLVSVQKPEETRLIVADPQTGHAFDITPPGLTRAFTLTPDGQRLLSYQGQGRFVTYALTAHP